MNNQTYQKRVQSIAEKMAKEGIESFCDLCGSADYIRDTGESYVPSACIAVAEMAEMAKRLLHSRFIREGYSHEQAGQMVAKELKYQGLIPDTEQDIGILPMQSGEPGYGGYDPNNPPPEEEIWRL